MEIKPHFIVLCREAFTAAGTNNLSLINIFTQITANQFPFVFSRFALVVNFDAATAGNHTLRTDVLDPQQKQIAHTELPVTTHVGNWQIIANFEQMSFPTPGIYRFQLSLDGTPLGERELDVRLLPVMHQKTNIA